MINGEMKSFLSNINVHNFGNIFHGKNIEWVHRPLMNMPYLTSRFE